MNLPYLTYLVRNQWRSDCPNKAASPTVLHIWDMQLGSTVFGVQHRLRCQSEAAATKPQRKVWAESGRSEDQNGVCLCTNAGSHMHKRSIYTKIHLLSILWSSAPHHSSIYRRTATGVSAAFFQVRWLMAGAWIWVCWFWASAETRLSFILMSLSAAVLKTTWIMWHTCGHISSFLTSVSDQQRNDAVVVKGVLPVGKFLKWIVPLL